MTESHRIPEAHRLVATTAHDMAQALYERWARDNVFYRKFRGARGRKLFVERAATALLPEARATLAGMLTRDYPDAVKAGIHEALTLDATLTRGRISRAEAAKALGLTSGA